MLTFIKNIFSYIFEWLFPPRNTEISTQSFKPENLLTIPRAKEIDQNTFALFSYKDIRVTSLVWEIKYHKNKTALSHTTPLLTDYIIEEYSERSLFENWNTCLLIPVPTTKKQKNKRGYSHTEFICENIIKLLPKNITYSPNILEKIIDTPAQHKQKDRRSRLKNLRGTQKVSGKIEPNTSVILIDDVTTTGATLNESKRALKEAGVKNIISFTIAH
ncbi:MAG: ComF family protein [Minisyncoccota bacterium]